MKCFSRFRAGLLVFSLLTLPSAHAQTENLDDPIEFLQCKNREFNSGVINFITEGEKLTRDIFGVSTVLQIDGEVHGWIWPFTSYEGNIYDLLGRRRLITNLVQAFTATRDLLQTSVCQRTFLASDLNFSTDMANADTQVLLMMGKDHSPKHVTKDGFIYGRNFFMEAVGLERFFSGGLRQPTSPMTILNAGPQSALIQTEYAESIVEKLGELHGKDPQILTFKIPTPDGEKVELKGIKLLIYYGNERGPLNPQEKAVLRAYYSTFFRYLGLAPRMLLASNGSHSDGGFKVEYNEWLAGIQSKTMHQLYLDFMADREKELARIKDAIARRRATLAAEMESLRTADEILKRKPLECNGGRCSHFPVHDVNMPRTFYFLFGNVDYPEFRAAIKLALLPTIEQLKAKGYRVILEDDANTMHLLAALKNPDTHSIYWNSHTKSTKHTARLVGAGNQLVPLDVFERTIDENAASSKLRSITIVGCQKKKFVEGYGLKTQSQNRGYQIFGHDGDNRVEVDFSTMRLTHAEDVLNKDFLNLVDHLPILPPEVKTAETPTQDYAVLRLEVADAVAMGRAYNITLDSNIIGYVSNNTAPGFQTMSVRIPVSMLNEGSHKLRIVTTERNVNFNENDNSNLLDDILVKNIRILFAGGRIVPVTETEEVTHIGDDYSAFGALSKSGKKWFSIDSRGEFENAAEGRINFSMDLNQYWQAEERPKSYMRVRFKIEEESSQEWI